MCFVFFIAVCLYVVKVVPSKTVELTITSGSVKNDQDNPFKCDTSERIELNSYTYKYRKSGKWTKSYQIHHPELLFSACSWKQTCNITDMLVQNITKSTNTGVLKIGYNCLGIAFYDTM